MSQRHNLITVYNMTELAIKNIENFPTTIKSLYYNNIRRITKEAHYLTSVHTAKLRQS
jgi:hypothetical protein